MSDHIFFDGVEYISSIDAGREFGITNGYVTQFCRGGHIFAKRVGKHWYVSRPALQAFLLEKRNAAEQRHEELARERAEEYRRLNKERPPLPSSRTVSRHSLPFALSPRAIFLQAGALVVAVALTLGVLVVADSAHTRLTLGFNPVASNELAAAGGASSFLGWLASLWGSGNDEIQYVPPKWEKTTVQEKPVVAETKLASLPTRPTIVNNYPVVERIIERALPAYTLANGSGITEDILNKKLGELDTTLSARIFSLSAANSTQITNVYQAAAAGGRIEHLKDLDLETPKIRGGTITGTGVSATSLVVSGTATSSFGGGLDISDGCFAIDGTCISGSGGGSSAGQSFELTSGYLAPTTSVPILVNNASSTITSLVTVNATSTNATSTNLFSASLVATSATSTNWFSTLGRVTTGIIDTLTSTLATITSLTATNLIATNATTTNSTSTTLAISGLGQGWFFGDGTGPVRASTSPTVNYLVATSTTVASQFWGGLISLASTTLQNFTGLNATTTNATTTSLFATALRATNGTVTNFLATSGTTTNATSTNFATTALCLTGDICRTTWPTGGSSNWTDGGAYLSPLTAGDGLLVNSASSTITNLVMVNSTTTNATTTNLRVSGTTILSGITSAIPLADAGGTIAEYAGTSCTNQFVRSLNGAGAATCAAVDLTADVSGDLPFVNLAQVSAASILGNPTGSTADARSVATSTFFGQPTAGFVLAFNGGQWVGVATTTLANISGTLAVSSGGTGQTVFGQGWLSSDGTTITASTSPTVNYLVATSTTVASQFWGGLISLASTTLQNFTGLNATTTNATTTSLFATALRATNGTVTNFLATSGTTTNATSTNFAVTNITSALPLAAADGSLQEYAGSSCTNQFVRSLNGAGAATCASVSLTADVTGVLAVANGGTGWANINAGSILFGNGSSALATSSSLFWDNTNSRLGIGTTTPFWQLQSAASAAASTFRGQLTLTDTSGGVDQKHWTFTSVGGEFRLGSSTDAYATSTLLSITNASTTFSKALFSSSLATSSFANGVNLTSGCWAVAGTCVGGGGGGSSNWTDGGAYLSPLTAGDGLLVNSASSTISNLDMLNSTSTNATSTRLYTSGQTILAATGGNVGIGTTSPFRLLSLTSAVSTAQQAIAYDTTNNTDILTSSVGDYFVYPSGKDALFNDSNLWVCTGGSGNTNGCPSGTPAGQGNLIVETKIGVASSTPWAALSIGADSAIVTTEKSLTDGATVAIDWNQGNQQKVTLGGNRTITFSNFIPAQILRLVVCQDGTGSRTLTWPATVLWSGGTAPTLTTTANKCDVMSFITTAATGTVKQFGASTLNF